MNKEPITNKVEILYITQYQYPSLDAWYDRFTFPDLPSAQMDLKWAREFATTARFQYKYRLIKRETTVKEYVEEG